MHRLRTAPMTLSGLLDAVLPDPALRRAVSGAASSADLTSLDASLHLTSLDLTAPPALRPLVAAALAADPARGGAGRPVLAVTATGRDADDLVDALRCLLPPDEVVGYPSWETLPHERLSPRADTVGRRLAVLRRLAHPSTDDPATGPVRVVVASIRAVLQPQVPGLGELEPVAARTGDTVELDELVERLASVGYTRVELVEKRGEFAVRGGILDVFPPTEEHPVRVEFWGDDVEEVRFFTVADQRSVQPAESGKGAQSGEHGLWAPPCRELLLTAPVRERAKQLAAEHPELAEMLDKLADGTAVEGMEALAPVLLQGIADLRLLFHELPAGSHVLVCDPERVRTRAAELVRTSEEFLHASWAAAAGGGTAPIDLGAAALRTVEQAREDAAALGIPWWSVTPFAVDRELDDSALTVDATAAEAYRGDTGRAIADARRWTRDGWRVAVVFDGHGPALRAVEQLGAAEVPVRGVPSLTAPPEPGVVTVSTGRLAGGFVSPSLRLAVLGQADLTGQRGQSTKDLRMPSRRRRNAVDPLALRPGDLVVHEQHGVGRYLQMVRRTVNGGEREYLILEYAPARRGQPGDRLFVPTDSLDLLTRYVGGEAPTLNRLGGADWAKTKGRARKAVKEIAGELIRLYSVRMATRGYAFAPDTPWQRELEDAFPYVETPDQLEAINEVKHDMEQLVPMDRVVCGDVGYGKTEIAVRAAFKAVQDGKQVAVLVPTTLLAQQHFATFSERLGQFPVAVRSLSRFDSPKETEATLAGLVDGSVDVVIGTHRLLQTTTRFKDLGLVIVDEEQRFGVEHKEYLKTMRTAVDVLSMSAT
ncbi:MAG: DEAD/DEAH box helicase, partial [Mycobacteriales bacterium]